MERREDDFQFTDEEMRGSNSGMRLRYADHLLSVAKKTGNLHAAVMAAQVYASLGQAERPSLKGKLLKASKVAQEKHWSDSDTRHKYLEQIRILVEKNPTSFDHHVKRYASGITAAFGLLSGLILIRPEVSGLAIAENVSISGNIIGSIALIIGVVGLFIWNRCR